MNTKFEHPENPETQPLLANNDGIDSAIALIRQKVANIYQEEPNAKKELAEIVQLPKPLSRHQQYMLDLSKSGRALSEIQTAWHKYYQDLPDIEKHNVWREFYASTTHHDGPQPAANQVFTSTIEEPPSQRTLAKKPRKPRQTRSIAEIKQQVLNTVTSQSANRAKSHIKSIFFGLSLGAVVVLILLFSFFNERFIAPFITPSKNVSATPIIVDPNLTDVGPEAKIIIPKINIEIPIDYTQTTIDEKSVQAALENGILYYPTTTLPGQTGNSVYFGHSSNNILNTGKFKFAFALLRKLENGDIFYIYKGGKRYTYRVYQKKVVKPTEVSVLGATDKIATATLITCDPPGTSINRLVIIGEQVNPDPNTNVASTPKQTVKPKELPSNAPSLWSRIIN